MGVEDVPFLHNHYHVLHAAVHKVNPEVGSRRRPPITVFDWKPDGTCHTGPQAIQGLLP